MGCPRAWTSPPNLARRSGKPISPCLRAILVVFAVRSRRGRRALLADAPRSTASAGRSGFDPSAASAGDVETGSGSSRLMISLLAIEAGTLENRRLPGFRAKERAVAASSCVCDRRRITETRRWRFSGVADSVARRARPYPELVLSIGTSKNTHSLKSVHVDRK
jgi:hypothetical protein